MDLSEAEVIKRYQEYTEELYKKDLHDPDNYNGVIILSYILGTRQRTWTGTNPPSPLGKQ